MSKKQPFVRAILSSVEVLLYVLLFGTTFLEIALPQTSPTLNTLAVLAALNIMHRFQVRENSLFLWRVSVALLVITTILLLLSFLGVWLGEQQLVLVVVGVPVVGLFLHSVFLWIHALLTHPPQRRSSR